jgi:hypothetical protein
MVIFVVAGVSVAFLNRLNQAAVLLLLDSGNSLSTLTTIQLHAMVLFLLEVHHQGEMMAVLFWGLWLLPLGLLIFKSGFIPRIIGILLICACVCYLIDFFLYFFFPSLIAIADLPLSLVETTAEVVFILWLLIKVVIEKNVT